MRSPPVPWLSDLAEESRQCDGHFRCELARRIADAGEKSREPSVAAETLRRYGEGQPASQPACLSDPRGSNLDWNVIIAVAMRGQRGRCVDVRRVWRFLDSASSMSSECVRPRLQEPHGRSEPISLVRLMTTPCVQQSSLSRSSARTLRMKEP